MVDREEPRFLTMEDGYDNAVDPPRRTRFAESSTESSRRLAALGKTQIVESRAQTPPSHKERGLVIIERFLGCTIPL